MAKRLVLKPDGWPCTLAECPPGHFLCNESVGLKSEYKSDTGFIDAYCDSGECFWGGAASKEARNLVMVQPLIAFWEDEE